MIQRKQTVFLLLAIFASLAALCLPLGTLRPEKLCVDSVIYCMWIQNGNGGTSLAPMPLFFILAASVTVSAVTIFLYKNRKLQIRLCSYNILLTVIWYITYAVIAYTTINNTGESLKVSFASVLPLVSLILIYMGRKGVKADEALIRAAERIR